MMSNKLIAMHNEYQIFFHAKCLNICFSFYFLFSFFSLPEWRQRYERASKIGLTDGHFERCSEQK